MNVREKQQTTLNPQPNRIVSVVYVWKKLNIKTEWEWKNTKWMFHPHAMTDSEPSGGRTENIFSLIYVGRLGRHQQHAEHLWKVKKIYTNYLKCSLYVSGLCFCTNGIHSIHDRYRIYKKIISSQSHSLRQIRENFCFYLNEKIYIFVRQSTVQSML